MQNDMLRAPYLGTDSLRSQYTDEDQSRNRKFAESMFVAITYPTEHQAAQVIKTLKKIEAAKLIDLEDAVYVTKNEKGTVKLHQAQHTTGKATAIGSAAGFVVGSLLLTPIGGAALGAAAGALAGKTSDVGIEDKFVRELSEEMKPNSSAIFLLVKSAVRDAVVPTVASYGGTVLETSLEPALAAELQAALNQQMEARSGNPG
jgi:uncharacterized membrane protein